jgi:hypothetical protein
VAQLYSDDRGVCRVYEMSVGQRFIGQISDDGNTIEGRWEKADDGRNFTTAFELIHQRV